jgi:hypothetical protein
LRQVAPERADHARGGPVEPGQQTQQRRLSGAARPEDRDELALADPSDRPLQRRCIALRRGEDAEDVA